MFAMSKSQNTVGYIVSTWPRLSQTFVLNEILALERLNTAVRVFSVKTPTDEPVHGDVTRVRARVRYLTFRGNRKSILAANLRLAGKQSSCYFRSLFRALGYFRWGVLKHFFRAAYLAQLLREEPVSRLHAHFATAPARVAMFTHWLTQIPYSFTAHARDIYVDQPPRLLRAEMKFADAVVTVSDYNRRYLCSKISPGENGKVRCIYNGLNLADFKFPPARDLQASQPLILSVGRLIEKKGFGDLLLACNILRKRGRDFRLEIIGAGPHQALLQNQTEHLNLKDKVKFLGAQPQEVVREALGHATVFALACAVSADGDRDGIPTVLMEAMACGTPVVSTLVSGIPELIETGKDGLLVPPNNPLLLADALDHLLHAPEIREQLAQAARAKMEMHFSIHTSAEQLQGLFQGGARL